MDAAEALNLWKNFIGRSSTRGNITVNKGWMHLFLLPLPLPHSNKFMMWGFLNCQSSKKTLFFCSADAGCRRPPISSKKGKLQSKNNEKCHNSCHDLFLSSSSVNNHRDEILHTFLEHQIKRSIKRIFYYIFHPFFKLKLHPLCAKGWAENF